jgi:hypothetical protein
MASALQNVSLVLRLKGFFLLALSLTAVSAFTTGAVFCVAGSWDALGVHFASEGWKDQKIIDTVKAHNKAVNG